MSYESPITAIYEQISNQINQDFENRIMAEVKMKVDVNVDKDELIKALNYDRGQYEKGVNDVKSVLIKMCKCRHPVKDDMGNIIFLCTNNTPPEGCECQCLWKGEDHA